MKPLRFCAALLSTGATLVAIGRTPAASAADAGSAYRQPPPVVADILTAPRVPRGAPNVSPDGERLVLPDIPPLVGIEVLAEPVEKLAGLEVLPVYHCTRQQLKSALSGFSIARTGDGKKVRARLPEGARVGRIVWSNRGDRVACILYAPGGGQLWIVDAATGAARQVERVKINTAVTSAIDWTNDDAALFCALVDERRAETEFRLSNAPGGPQVRVGAGKPTPQRTARSVLQTPEDRDRFERAVGARLARVPVAAGSPKTEVVREGETPNGATFIGTASMLVEWAIAPDEKHVILETVTALPYGFPWYLFPRRVDIVTIEGSPVSTLGEVPLNDRSAISSVAALGPRSWTWAPDGRSVWFFSWEDHPGADFAAAIRDTTRPQPGVDRLMRLDAPFTGAPQAVAFSDFQYQSMVWTADGKRLVLAERYEPRRRERLSWMDATGGKPAPIRLIERSTEGVYDNPGKPMTRAGRHRSVLRTSRDGRTIYLAGDGFRPDGQRPFVDALDLESAKRTRIYESAPDVLEFAMALLDDAGARIVTLRQSNTLVPNYHVRRKGSKATRRISDYADPAPALTASKRIQFQFPRPDGVKLNAEVVLPGDWKGGPLPTVFWVYPSDYRSAAAASQNRRSPNRFPSQSPLNPEVLVTQGYAVVYPDIAVVGSNDRYVEEIGISARAALAECVRRGFTDSTRVGVGGHSYGAFSTANLLAHTDLFRAGVASDGAYNRTLTPFTFQAEERNLWQARDTYIRMSPFLHADQIDEPLLLLHNLDDTNVGTHPMQSQRLYEALNGLGKTVTLVEYPFEDHAPAARESVLDYWARVIEWLDRYVKEHDTRGAARP